jgi:predicted N-acetyltransferase YhbS
MTSIRAYRPEDYEALKALYETPDSFGGQFDEDRDSATRMNEQAQEDPESILVAEENGSIIGTVSILQDKRFAWLLRFAVSNDQTAELLFNEASTILKRKGHSQVLVYAPNSSTFVERYSKLGLNTGNSYTSFWRILN